MKAVINKKEFNKGGGSLPLECSFRRFPIAKSENTEKERRRSAPTPLLWRRYFSD
jgi:hypothetical protein